MTLPDFLIIGAMKAGTTSLYRDLLTNPEIFMPLEKEPESLLSDEVLSGRGRAAYESLFAPSQPEQCCGEASTGYTKLPDHAGVPQRALQLLGPELRVVYLVRDPVKRIVSHHHHSVTTGVFSIDDVNIAVREYPQLLNWSRYAMQAQTWIDVFSRAQVRIVRFEEYVSHRRETVAELSTFVGVTPRPELVEVDRIFNQSEGKPVPTTGWKRVRNSRLYRFTVRPLLSQGLRDRVRTMVMPKAPPPKGGPSDDTVAFIRAELADDARALDALIAQQ
ncbi:MAG: sulfotransferase [Phycisphaerales bacterium]